MSQFTSILTIEDFKAGETRISQNHFEKDTLKSYISEVQEDVLKKLLGVNLYLEFGAQLPNPTSRKFNDLLNGVVYTCDDNTFDYTGLKRMLKYFTYNEYVNDQDVQNTIIGNVSGKSRNSENLTPNATLAFSEAKNNKGVDYYKEARKFIEDNNEQKRVSSSIVDNLNNTYTVFVSDTLYMVTGEKFILNGDEYTFGAITENNNFTFNADSGLNFPNESEIIYEIFSNFNGIEKNKSFFGGAISWQMATFTISAAGANLNITKDSTRSKARFNLFEIEIKIVNNILVFLPNGVTIDFASDTVTGYASPEELADQIGVWIEEANAGA